MLLNANPQVEDRYSGLLPWPGFSAAFFAMIDRLLAASARLPVPAGQLPCFGLYGLQLRGFVPDPRSADAAPLYRWLLPARPFCVIELLSHRQPGNILRHIKQCNASKGQ